MKKRASARKPPHSEKRYGETRRPIERIFEIHQAIQGGSFPNCRTLGEQIGVIPKTIQRDVTFMQKDLGLPIEYDIGYDPDRKARRTFALQRIRRARPLKVRFLRPADFSLKDHLGGSFGVWHSPGEGGKRQRIRLRFTGWAARLVSERRWHPSQQIEWKGSRTTSSS